MFFKKKIDKKSLLEQMTDRNKFISRVRDLIAKKDVCFGKYLKEGVPISIVDEIRVLIIQPDSIDLIIEEQERAIRKIETNNRENPLMNSIAFSLDVLVRRLFSELKEASNPTSEQLTLLETIADYYGHWGYLCSAMKYKNYYYLFMAGGFHFKARELEKEIEPIVSAGVVKLMTEKRLKDRNIFPLN